MFLYLLPRKTGHFSHFTFPKLLVNMIYKPQNLFYIFMRQKNINIFIINFYVQNLIDRQLKQINKEMQLLRKLKFNITKLDSHYLSNPNQLAVVFGPTKNRWTHRDLITQTKAFAKGLHEARFIPGDTILVKLNHNHLQQKLVIKIAAASLKVKVVNSEAKNAQQLQQQFNKTHARSFVFSSFDPLGESTVIDTLYRIIPQLLQAPYNSQLPPGKTKFLRRLIQIDDYKLRGSFSYNKMMKYVSDLDYNLEYNCQENVIEIQDFVNLKRPILITDPCSDLAFRAGILNMLQYGKLLLCSSPALSKSASQHYQHNLDIICTEPMGQINNSCNLFVQKGSPLYQRHPKLTQLFV